MTKNQKTYFLLALVLGIWGFIGYKVASTLNPTETPPTERALPQNNGPKEVRKRTPILISANYRDPFLGTLPKSAAPKKATAVKKEMPKPPVRNIGYSGSVAQNGSEDRIYFITIEGQQYLMEKNQQVNGVTLVSGNEHAVVVTYTGHRQTIERSN